MVFKTQGLAVDADGAPNSYLVDGKGLGGRSAAQSSLITTTTLTVRARRDRIQKHWVDSVQIPYLVAPAGDFRHNYNSKPGKVTVVYRPKTVDGQEWNKSIQVNGNAAPAAWGGKQRVQARPVARQLPIRKRPFVKKVVPQTFSSSTNTWTFKSQVKDNRNIRSG